MSIIKTGKVPRVRRSPEAARENILAAAERLLVAQGPQALKLADVAAEAGIANASVLHHFGSIDEVQTALMERMVADLVARILAVSEVGAEPSPAGAQTLFDAFEAPGVARLAAWLEMTGEAKRMTMVRGAVQKVVARLSERTLMTPAEAEDLIMASVVLAMGVGLFGRALSTLMGKPAGHTRDLAMALLVKHVAHPSSWRGGD
ncbi:MAG: TetR/AcrR family transcriptional regulator [Caulobacterales bacterium]|jgi:AcrR family transcriptional regulator|nr:TetR/AcrR family transcriptional regulator [Caulobacterales bacterium]